MTRTVSVVIPTHDRDQLLPRAIASVSAQELPVHEVIVVDDRGSAETRTVVEKSGDAGVPVRYVDASALPLQGPSVSRNAGARVATGDTLAFLDDDDHWLPDYLATALPELDVSGRCCVVTWTSRTRDGRRLRGSHLDPTVDHTDPAHLYWAFGVTGSNLVVDAAAFAAIGGYDEAMWSREDYEIFVRLLAGGRGYGLVAKELVVQDADGEGHLAGKSLRAAAAVPRYLEKHGAKMSIRQRRGAWRHYHAMSSSPENSTLRRVGHRVLMLWFSNPRDWRIMTVDRLAGNRSPTLR